MTQTSAHQRRELMGDFSLEISGKDLHLLKEAQSAIPPGTKINITYLGNEDMEMRVAAAQAAKELGFIPVPHIAARRLDSRAQLEDFLARLQAINASEHVFVVAGDPTTPAGPYASAADILSTGVLPAYGVREVSIAGYPDGHPGMSSTELWKHLEEKASSIREQGLNAVVLTQFSFDTDLVMAWIKGARARGIDAEIRIGTPGPAGIKRLIGFASRFGVGTSASIVKKYGFSLTNLLGTAGPGRFIGELSDMLHADPSGAVKLHFYTFGGLNATAQWACSYIEENAA